MLDWELSRSSLLQGTLPSDEEALSLAEFDDLDSLVNLSSALRDAGGEVGDAPAADSADERRQPGADFEPLVDVRVARENRIRIDRL